MVDHDHDLINHQHGQWQQDYRGLVPTPHDPDQSKPVAVAVNADEHLVGYIAWKPDPRPEHAEIEPLAVTASARRQEAGSG
jgi:hypothetical protein